MVSRTKNAVRNMFAGIIYRIVAIIAPFIIRTMIIKYLGSEYAGLGSLFTSILQVLSLAELGFGSALVFSMYKPIAENNLELLCALYAFYKKIYRIIGGIVCAAGLCILPFLNHFISGDVPADVNIYLLYLIYLANTVISYWLFAYKDSLLQAHQRYDISTNILTITNLLMYIVQMTLLSLFRNYYLYIIILPLCTVANNIIKSIMVDKLYPEIKCRGQLDKESKQGLYKRVTGLMLNKIGGVCRNSFDSIIISSFLGLVVLAYYQNYFIIVTALVSIIGILNSSINAGIGDSIARESKEKNYRDFNTLFFMLNWLTGWFAICMICLYQPFITLWLGEEYLLPFYMTVLFGIYLYTQEIGNVASIYRQATGLWWEDKIRPVVEAILNLILNIALVRFLGIMGIVLATIISITLINIPWGSATLFKCYFNMKPYKYWLKIILNFLPVAVICVITYFICDFIPFTGNGSFLLKMIICAIVPNILLVITYFRTKEFKHAITLAKGMLFGGRENVQ